MLPSSCWGRKLLRPPSYAVKHEQRTHKGQIARLGTNEVPRNYTQPWRKLIPSNSPSLGIIDSSKLPGRWQTCTLRYILLPTWDPRQRRRERGTNREKNTSATTLPRRGRRRDRRFPPTCQNKWRPLSSSAHQVNHRTPPYKSAPSRSVRHIFRALFRLSSAARSSWHLARGVRPAELLRPESSPTREKWKSKQVSSLM